MKIKEIPKFLDIVTLIGVVLLRIDALPRDIVFYFEEILSHGKYKRKILLQDHLLRPSIK